ncbi:MAG: hypothetical protein V8Q84_01490 [Bilophila sp.]
MTRLTENDITDIGTAWTDYERRLHAVTGCGLFELAAGALGLDPVRARRETQSLRVGAIPVSSGEGIIGGFAASLASIAAHLGFEAEVLPPDAEGFRLARGYDLFIWADDDTYLADPAPAACPKTGGPPGGALPPPCCAWPKAGPGRSGRSCSGRARWGARARKRWPGRATRPSSATSTGTRRDGPAPPCRAASPARRRTCPPCRASALCSTPRPRIAVSAGLPCARGPHRRALRTLPVAGPHPGGRAPVARSARTRHRRHAPRSRLPRTGLGIAAAVP